MPSVTFSYEFSPIVARPPSPPVHGGGRLGGRRRLLKYFRFPPGPHR